MDGVPSRKRSSMAIITWLRWWWMARVESLWPFYESVFPEEEEMQYAMPQGAQG